MKKVKTQDYDKLIIETKKPKGNIVFIHGFGSKFENFDELRKKFKDFNFYSINLPGHGNSKFSSINEIDFIYFANVIYSFILELNLDKFILLGSSFGASISLHISNFFSKKITCLILETPITKEIIENFNLIKKIVPDSLEDTKIIYNKFFYKINNFFKTKKEMDNYLMKRFNDFSSRQALKTIFNIDRISFWINIVEKSIKDNNVKTLVILGEYDEITPPIKTKFLFEKYDNYNIQVVKESAHFPIIEQPEKIYPIIFNFIKKYNK